MRHLRLSFFGLAMLLLGATLVSSPKTNALEVPVAPTIGYIVDSAEILSEQEEAQLNTQIQTIENQTTNEIGILTVKDGEGVDPAQFATQLGRDWGVGSQQNKNGVVVFVSLQNPKRIQIAVSTGLEGALTDALSGRIARSEIAPKFKEEKYYDGLSAGISAIDSAIKGEYSATSSDTTPKQNIQNGAWAFIAGIIFLQFIVSLITTTKSWWLGGVIGFSASALLGLIAGSLLLGVIFAIILIPIGLLIDRSLSKNYQKHVQRKKNDKNYIFPWYFGGGGGFGSGSSGGGFSGGGFSGGGSFGGGGGGSSW